LAPNYAVALPRADAGGGENPFGSGGQNGTLVQIREFHAHESQTPQEIADHLSYRIMARG
jgi:hypothetical protein